MYLIISEKKYHDGDSHFVVEAKTQYHDIAKDKLNAYKIIDDKKIYHLVELPLVLNKQVA